MVHRSKLHRLRMLGALASLFVRDYEIAAIVSNEPTWGIGGGYGESLLGEPMLTQKPSAVGV
jgi:hypothetical protein